MYLHILMQLKGKTRVTERMSCLTLVPNPRLMTPSDVTTIKEKLMISIYTGQNACWNSLRPYLQFLTLLCHLYIFNEKKTITLTY
jgi:hypothetical protein